jgi:hypothetical protein
MRRGRRATALVAAWSLAALSVAGACLSPAALADDRVVSLPAAMDGDVSGLAAGVTGSGQGYYGDALRVFFQNATSDSYVVEVPIGLRLVPADESVQTMYAAGGERLDVPPGESSQVIKGFCGEHDDGAPGADDTFTADGVAGGALLDTLQAINDEEAFDADGQAAVWHQTDGTPVEGNQVAEELVGGSGFSGRAAAGGLLAAGLVAVTGLLVSWGPTLLNAVAGAVGGSAGAGDGAVASATGAVLQGMPGTDAPFDGDLADDASDGSPADGAEPPPKPSPAADAESSPEPAAPADGGAQPPPKITPSADEDRQSLPQQPSPADDAEPPTETSPADDAEPPTETSPADDAEPPTETPPADDAEPPTETPPVDVEPAPPDGDGTEPPPDAPPPAEDAPPPAEAAPPSGEDAPPPPPDVPPPAKEAAQHPPETTPSTPDADFQNGIDELASRLDQRHYVRNRLMGDPTLVGDGIFKLGGILKDATYGNIRDGLRWAGVTEGTAERGLTCEGFCDASQKDVKALVEQVYGKDAQLERVYFEEASTRAADSSWGDWFDSFNDENHVLFRVTTPDGKQKAVDFWAYTRGDQKNAVVDWSEAEQHWKKWFGSEYCDPWSESVE